jgi:AraC-like DNA-binding protein
MRFVHDIHPALAGPGTIGNTCCRVKDLEPQLRRAGWLADIRKPGPENVQVAGSACTVSANTVVDVRFSHRLDVTGRIKSDMVAVLIPQDGARFLINGFTVGDGDILALPPEKRVVASCNSDARLLQLVVPARSLHAANLFAEQDLRVLSAGQVLRENKGSARYDQISRYAESLLERAPETNEFAYSIEQKDEDMRFRWDRGETCAPGDTDLRIIRLSVDFVETNLADEISVSDLSNVAATSLSKLERTYRQKLGMSPTQYILARRLAAARRALAFNDASSTSVAAIAHNCGFNHLGRFSGAYRRHFGEQPRETLHFGQV